MGFWHRERFYFVFTLRGGSSHRANLCNFNHPGTFSILQFSKYLQFSKSTTPHFPKKKYRVKNSEFKILFKSKLNIFIVVILPLNAIKLSNSKIFILFGYIWNPDFWEYKILNRNYKILFFWILTLKCWLIKSVLQLHSK